jgi:hypothetical protein
MVDRLGENGAIKYAQQFNAPATPISRLAGAGQIEADIFRLIVDGYYTEKVSGLTVRGRLINKMIDSGFVPARGYSFADGSNTLDSSITFSRASNATVTDNDGLIKYAAHNLLPNSESFDNASWSKSNSTITTNVIAAPNGTLTADKLVEDTNNTFHRVQAANAGIGKFILSVYVKPNGRNWVAINFANLTNGLVNFNIANGTIGTQQSAVEDATITAAGNGWYRVTSTVTLTSTLQVADIIISKGNEDYSYLGDDTSGIYVWGAQLTALPCVSNDYISTSPANLLGFTEEFENAAWTKSNSFVQTNLLLNSENFGTTWVNTESSETLNVAVAPNGTMTADKLVENTSTNFHAIEQTVTSLSAVVHTFSVYAKYTERNIQIFFGFNDVTGNPHANFDLQNGTVGTTGGTITASIQSVGDGWYRCIATITSAVTSDFQCFVNLISSTSAARAASYTGNGTSGALLWGAQLVQGATAGDYMQTGASTMATRYLDPFGSVYAKLLTATAGNGTALQTYTAVAVPYTFSGYIKRATGTGDIEITVDGSTYQSVSVTSDWTRFSVTTTPAAGSKTAGFRIVTSGDAIYVTGAQLSNSASLDPYVYNPTTALTSAAVYGARFNYDPVTLDAQGLLIEEQRVNYCLWSEDFSQATWSKTTTTVTSNSEIAPSGLQTADTLTATGANAITKQAITTTAVAFTFSVYLKRKTGTGNIDISMDGTTFVTQTINSNTWTRCIVTQTGVAGTSNPSIRIATDADEVYAWGAQVEAGAFPTSYIPTVASSVTRSADIATVLGRNFSSWYNQYEGTVFVDSKNPDTGTRGIIGTNDGSANNRIELFTSTLDPKLIVQNASSAQADLDAGTIVANVNFKLAAEYKVNDFAVVEDGGTVQTDTSGQPPVVDRMTIGNNQANNYMNGTIKSIRYWPTRLTNAQLQAITS